MRAEWDNTGLDTAFSRGVRAERIATATSTETGNEAVQTAKTAAELSALRALDFASALALLEAAVINLNDIEL